ncbi:hypothetical protein K1719_003654 [Acacia pycnantha]|nr:hypothetical protein K1719_003654 [Acacia pycnantha]
MTSESPASILPVQVALFLDGGLNRQRMGICDAVAVAKILNMILVIPYLEVNPVWRDSRSFGIQGIIVLNSFGWLSPEFAYNVSMGFA